MVPDDGLLTNKPKFMSAHIKILGDNGQTLKNSSKGCEYKYDGKKGGLHVQIASNSNITSIV